MTPKEKAFFLLSRTCLLDCTDENINKSKTICRIWIDELMINEPKKSYFIKGTWITPNNYWKQVLIEINKL
jgi:hypothetical protein